MTSREKESGCIENDKGGGAVIALIDYGAGNLTSVRKGFAAAGVELTTPRDPSDLAQAAAIVVPGVGHFAATKPLDHGWCAAIRLAVDRGPPLLGICLGLQWLFEGSEEAPEVAGLGLLSGRCARLPNDLKVPHVGWNSLSFTRPSRLLDGVADEIGNAKTKAFESRALGPRFLFRYLHAEFQIRRVVCGNLSADAVFQRRDDLAARRVVFRVC